MITSCPKCGSKNLRNARARTVWEDLKSVLGYESVRCKSCGHRHSGGLFWLERFRHARCPKCYRPNLVDWSEPYYYPPQYARMLLYVGAKRHRCSICRHNFVSFLPRAKPDQDTSAPTSRRAVA